jgi:hypothetical protein
MVEENDYSDIFDWWYEDGTDPDDDDNGEDDDENGEDDDENGEDDDETPNAQQEFDDWVDVQAVRPTMYENNLDIAAVYCPEEMVTKVFIGHDCTSDLEISLKICAEAWESNPMVNTAHS